MNESHCFLQVNDLSRIIITLFTSRSTCSAYLGSAEICLAERFLLKKFVQEIQQDNDPDYFVEQMNTFFVQQNMFSIFVGGVGSTDTPPCRRAGRLGRACP